LYFASVENLAKILYFPDFHEIWIILKYIR
jgi:hypothetical protein